MSTKYLRAISAMTLALFSLPAKAQHAPELRSTLTTNSGGVYSLVIPNDPEVTWKQAYFTPEQCADPAISGPNADPDGDGLPNAVERLMAHHPLTPEAGYPYVGIYSYLATTDPLYGSMSLTIPRSHAASDLDPVVQVSPDLKRWKSGEEFTYVNPLHTAPFPPPDARDSWEVTARLRTTDTPKLFMRYAPVRPSRINFVESLGQLEAIPADLLDQCVVPSGEFAGALTTIPRVYTLSHYALGIYHINWYFANVGLIPFVDAKPTVVKNHLVRHLATLASDNRIRDYNIRADNYEQDAAYPSIASDSDDSYAGTFLGLASRYAMKYPSDPWFGANVARLKAVWVDNIKSQTNVKKPGSPVPANGLVRTFQGGAGAFGDFCYLEDNVEVWADTLLFAQALKGIGDTAGETECLTYCENLRAAIHNVLWDSTKNAWKVADTVSSASRGYYYAYLQCQYFPELYGFTHPSGYEETQRRYDAAWAWLEGGTKNDGTEDQGPAWWTSAAWNSYTAGQTPETVHQVYSDMALAAVAMRRGKFENARAYMAFALDRWMTDNTRVPDNANKSGTWPGTVVSDIGYWHYLLKGAIPKP